MSNFGNSNISTKLIHAEINGNYALEGGLRISDALAKEASDSLAAQMIATNNFNSVFRIRYLFLNMKL